MLAIKYIRNLIIGEELDILEFQQSISFQNPTYFWRLSCQLLFCIPKLFAISFTFAWVLG